MARLACHARAPPLEARLLPSVCSWQLRHHHCVTCAARCRAVWPAGVRCGLDPLSPRYSTLLL